MRPCDTSRLVEIAVIEFADIVEEAYCPDPGEVRIILIDGSYIDIWFSLKLKGRYSYHWERRALDGKIYRHDNAPHKRWEGIVTFPRHFHNGSEAHVEASNLSEVPEEALRQFLSFARDIISKSGK
ncbi:MAG: DUF6516 family protein [Bacillota bacterium]|nr:DUF6516 family protein [Bacillota bacterium]